MILYFTIQTHDSADKKITHLLHKGTFKFKHVYDFLYNQYNYNSFFILQT